MTQIDTEITNENFLYKDITYQIRGACFDVWKKFGGAFKERVIDNALTIALQKRGLVVENQKRIEVYFENKKVGYYVPDKIINDKIILEIKCKPYITKEDKNQFWLYFKSSKYKIGLLINFGSRNLEIERRIYDKARARIPQNSASPSA